MIKRLLDCTGSDFEKMSAEELKESIRMSEGRTLMAQSFNGLGSSLVDNATNPELEAAFGADMLMLNGYSLDEKSPLYGIRTYNMGKSAFDVMLADQLKKLVRRPVGIYLECVPLDRVSPYGGNAFFLGRIAVEENFHKCVEQGADFIVLGANPGNGAKLSDIVVATKACAKAVKGKTLIFSGKWEDGVDEKVLGDPLASIPARTFIDQLMDAGADVINFPCPGSRQGITVDMIRELVEYVHKKDAKTMTMSFLDGSVEGTDVDTIRILSIKSRETGADIHTLGDAGLCGCSLPENIYQMSLCLKGRRLTYRRMAAISR